MKPLLDFPLPLLRKEGQIKEGDSEANDFCLLLRKEGFGEVSIDVRLVRR